jgi:translocation and assembly module TamB
MRRRRLVLLVSAITFGVLGILAIGLILFVTRTSPGREQLRRVIAPFVASKIQGGKVYIGAIGGNFINEITVDSLAIRDKDDELFISTGRVSVSFDLRDIADYRLFFRRARIERPYVHLIQHEDGSWNFRRIFASGKPQGPKPLETPRRKFGDYLVVDSAWATDGTFLLTMPWHPADSLDRRGRDSSIKAHVEDPRGLVKLRKDGYGRTYTWTNAHGLIRHARIADRDSNHLGRRFVVDTISVDEYEPTFKFRNLSGDIKHLGDSIWIDVPHFELPASRGSATGKVWWGSNRPMRVNIAIHGDSVSLDDVNWAYATLPRTGGGSLDLVIQNDPKNERIMDYHLRKMDVRSMKSRLVGNMSFGVGAPVLLVRHLDLRADPVDFDLIRQLNGKPFPYDWRGQLFGTVKGRGGPVTNFVLDDVRGSFRDAHVPGAVSRFAARGELDILYPAYTAFHGFEVDAEVLDLRTIRYLNKNFPPLGGVISGRATLDSSWLDVRFSDADITHQDGPGDPSHLTGSGRVTFDELMTYDVALDARPLSLTMLARSYPTLPFRGLLSGPIRATGQAPNLELETTLQGSNGALSFAGRVDVDSIGGYGAHGRGSFSALNVSGLLENPKIPAGTLSGRYETDVAGETAAQLQGSVQLDLDATTIDSVRVYGTKARIELADGRMRLVDSVRLQTVAGTLVARGGFGLPKGRADSLDLTVTVDSLGGLRRYLGTRDTTVLAATAAVTDSLSGSAEFRGRLSGTMDSFSLTGTATGTDLYLNKDRSQSAKVTLALRDLPSAANGIVELKLDTLSLGSLALETVGGSLALRDPKNARFSASALSKNGPTLATIGEWSRVADGHRVTLDSLGLSVDDARWQLLSRAHVEIDSSGGVRLDSATIRNRDSAVVVLAANVPAEGPATARLRGSRIPLLDLGTLAQLRDSITGVADINVDVTGTKLHPEIAASADLRSMSWGSVEIDGVRATSDYRSGRFFFDLDAMRHGRSSLTAKGSWPAAVTLFSMRPRNDTVRAEFQADTIDLEVVKTLIPALRSSDVKGRLTAKFEVDGTSRAPEVSGSLRVADGQAYVPQLGVTISSINGSVVGTRKGAGQDSLSVALTASTGGTRGQRAGAMRLGGYVKNLLQSNNQQTFSLWLTSNRFHALNLRSTADLYMSTTDTIRLTGTTKSATLRGGLVVDEGSIYLADRDIARKQAVDITAETDSALARRSPLVDTLMTYLRVDGVNITLGEDVRLRSAEANVKLSGSLQLQASTNRSRRIVSSTGALIPLFDLDGVLETESGSYKLALGPVQREFTVLTGGTVTFDGDPNNPLLDIRAQHNVRRPGDRDLGVIVTVAGRLLPYPNLGLTSNAEYAIAQSDLISYLLIGRSGFDYGSNTAAAQQIAAVFAPTFSAFAADQLRQRLGLSSFVDAFQFQFGTSDDQFGGANNNLRIRDYLYSSTVGAEKQFKNVFLSLNTGFCGLQNTVNYDPRNALGAKAEVRFMPELSVKLSYDPPTRSSACTQQSNIGLLPTTPGQFGLSFLHTWRF